MALLKFLLQVNELFHRPEWMVGSMHCMLRILCGMGNSIFERLRLRRGDITDIRAMFGGCNNHHITTGGITAVSPRALRCVTPVINDWLRTAHRLCLSARVMIDLPACLICIVPWRLH